MPAAVVIKASEIPLATNPGFPVPLCEMTSKALIIPNTVPNNPIIGVMFAMAPKARKLEFSKEASC